MRTRCKFKCNGTDVYYGDCHTAHFSAVIDGSEENKEFFKYTPGGQLSLSVMKVQHFEVGKEYYLDITEARKNMVYYIDLKNGNDDNDGLTPETAKKSDAGIVDLSVGDSIKVGDFIKNL